MIKPSHLKPLELKLDNIKKKQSFNFSLQPVNGQWANNQQPKQSYWLPVESNVGYVVKI